MVSRKDVVDRASRIDPLKNDGLSGHWTTRTCAGILTMIGDHDRAIDLLEELLDAPTGISAEGLAIDPTHVALRDHPRFQALIKKYENKHE